MYITAGKMGYELDINVFAMFVDTECSKKYGEGTIKVLPKVYAVKTYDEPEWYMDIWVEQEFGRQLVKRGELSKFNKWLQNTWKSKQGSYYAEYGMIRRYITKLGLKYVDNHFILVGKCKTL